MPLDGSLVEGAAAAGDEPFDPVAEFDGGRDSVRVRAAFTTSLPPGVDLDASAVCSVADLGGMAVACASLAAMSRLAPR